MNISPEDLARFMSYAYERGRLDGAQMPEGVHKEELVERYGKENAANWIVSAEALLDTLPQNQ